MYALLKSCVTGSEMRIPHCWRASWQTCPDWRSQPLMRSEHHSFPDHKTHAATTRSTHLVNGNAHNIDKYTVQTRSNREKYTTRSSATAKSTACSLCL